MNVIFLSFSYSGVCH
jgi:hypothetical protein